MIWQDWISSFCQRHRAKGSLPMLSVMSSTRCSAIIWPRRHMPTLTRTTRRHRNSAQNWGSSASQGRSFSKRAQRIWRSLGIHSKAPAQQNQPKGIHLWLDVWVPRLRGDDGDVTIRDYEKAHRLGRNAGGFLTGGFRKGGGYLA